MSEMIERVAKAILTAASPTNAYDDIAFRDTATVLARAAIEAMREPTSEMISAGAVKFTNLHDIWPAMIDAALAEQPKISRETVEGI